MKIYKTESSNIKSVGYDLKEKNLVVTFNSNSSYSYLGVEPEEVCELMFADSIGEKFHHKIKKFDAKKV